jgi:hypothetical protein
MSLNAKFELKIDGDLLMEIRFNPEIEPDGVADILEDAGACLRVGYLEMMECGDSMPVDNVDPDSRNEAHEPLQTGWTYFNYTPETSENEPATHHDDSSARRDLYIYPSDLLPDSFYEGRKPISETEPTTTDTTATKPKRDFHGEQPLIGEIPYTINGIPAVTINYHPAMGLGGIADILEDAAKDLRKELESRNPLLYDPDTVSLTVPAMRVGSHLTNLMNSYDNKFYVAMELEDYDAADKFFGKAERLYEWMCRNYTPEAIKNSPELQQHTLRLESFRGIKEAKTDHQP